MGDFMVKIKIIDNDKTTIINVSKGSNLLDVLRKHGYYISASCGGKGTCKKCKVKYLNKDILSCQTVITEDMTVELNTNISTGLEEMLSRTYEVEEQNGYGIAFDLGTTTIAAYLMNLQTGSEIGSYSVLNTQASYGADVVSRIQQCEAGFLQELNTIIVKQFNDIINHFQNQAMVDKIEKIVVSANTTMLHILANVNPSSLGKAPFKPQFIERKEFSGAELKINVNKVILLPSISAYIGSDIVSGMLAIDISHKKGNLLFVDMGTNGEIILKTDDAMYGTSTAAGPAFEGAKIEFGTGGIPGAISKVSLHNQELKLTTIDNKQAIGICGSALVEIISLLIKEAIIDETGLLQSSNNLVKHDKFYLDSNIYISQRDIREFQLAKSAIASGIKTLVGYAGLTLDAIDKIYLAGGFGFYLNKGSAISVGLLPKEFKGKQVVVVGNSSGEGAKMALINAKYLRDCDNIYRQVEVVELANNKVFADYFIENILFEIN